MPDYLADWDLSESHDLKDLRERLRSDVSPFYTEGYATGAAASRADILAALQAHGLHRWQPGYRRLATVSCEVDGCVLWRHQHLDWLFDLLEAKP